MRNVFFHLIAGDEETLDEEGRSFSAISDVISVALSEARSIISADALEGRIDLDQHLRVENGRGKVIHRLAFSDAVEIFKFGFNA